MSSPQVSGLSGPQESSSFFYKIPGVPSVYTLATTFFEGVTLVVSYVLVSLHLRSVTDETKTILKESTSLSQEELVEAVTQPGITLEQVQALVAAQPGVTLEQVQALVATQPGVTLEQVQALVAAQPGVTLEQVQALVAAQPGITLEQVQALVAAQPGVTLEQVQALVTAQPGVTLEQVQELVAAAPQSAPQQDTSELTRLKAQVSLLAQALQDTRQQLATRAEATAKPSSNPIWDRIKEAKESNATSLDLSGFGLDSKALVQLLPMLTEIKSLRELDLGNNQITVIPHTFFEQLPKLTRLNLSFNFLQANSLGRINRLTNLRELNLKGNQLSDLPNTFADLGTLRKLDLSHNDLIAVPPVIRNLRKLTHLDLSWNGIRELPGEVVRPLSNLTHLSLGNNKLRTLPENLNELLPNLEQITVQGNKGFKVPDALWKRRGFLGLFSPVQLDVARPPLAKRAIKAVGSGAWSAIAYGPNKALEATAAAGRATGRAAKRAAWNATEATGRAAKRAAWGAVKMAVKPKAIVAEAAIAGGSYLALTWPTAATPEAMLAIAAPAAQEVATQTMCVANSFFAELAAIGTCAI